MTDPNKPIAEGFAAYCAVMVPPSASPPAIDEVRYAFFSGAQLIASIVSLVGNDSPANLNQMAAIAFELEQFDVELERVAKARGKK